MAFVKTGTYFNKQSYLLENEKLCVEFIASGSRMISFYDKTCGAERLLQSDRDCFIPRIYGSSMPDCDPCGFDEMFSTIDRCFCEAEPWRGTEMPDHGEVWALDWEARTEEHAVSFLVSGIRFPYTLKKTVKFTNAETIRMEYRLKNNSSFPFPFLWAAHPMLQLTAGTIIMIPPECRTGYTICGGGDVLGAYGDVFDLAGIPGMKRGEKDLTFRFERRDGCEQKYYIRQPLTNGFVQLLYPDAGKLKFHFDTKKTPYLGLLFNDEEEGWGIVEPATAPYDRVDIAGRYGLVKPLEPFGERSWYLEMGI